MGNKWVGNNRVGFDRVRIDPEENERGLELNVSPLEEIMQISTDKLFSLEKPIIKNGKIIKLIKMATSEVQFGFNNAIYIQTEGVAMGLLLWPTLANKFMGHLECSMVPSLSSQIIYIRCMDDCLVISKTKEDNKTLFGELSRLHNMISFTR